MKLIIAGSRGIHDLDIVAEAIVASGFEEISVIFSGGAGGVDRLGELWAEQSGLPIRRFVPDWDGQGRSAGFIRNAEMAAEADALIAVWDGSSRGTANMIDQAQRRSLRVYVHRVGS